jgi:hypothetical protein
VVDETDEVLSLYDEAGCSEILDRFFYKFFLLDIRTVSIIFIRKVKPPSQPTPHYVLKKFFVVCVVLINFVNHIG